MPRVPRRQEVGLPRPPQAPTPSVQAFGGGASQPLKEAAGIIGDIGKEREAEFNEEVSRARQALVSDANAKLTRLELGTTRKHGEMLGLDAGDSEADMLSSFDSEAGAILREVRDPESRRVVEQNLAKSRLRLETSMRDHSTKQTLAFEAKARESQQLAGAELAVSAVGVDGSFDPDKWSDGSQMAIQALITTRGFMQQDDVTQQRQIRAIQSEINKKVLEGMVRAGNVDQADLLFEAQFNQDMTPDDKSKIKKLLTEAKEEKEVSERISAMAAPGVTRAEALAAAAKIKNSRVRNKVSVGLKKHFDVTEALEKEAKESLMDEIMSRTEKNPGVLPENLVDPEVWSSLSPKERKAISSFAKEAQAPAISDFVNVFEMKEVESSREKMLEWALMDVEEWYNKHYKPLNAAHREQALTVMKNARKLLQSELTKEPFQISSTKERLRRRAKEFLIEKDMFPADNESATDDDKRRMGKFLDAVDSALKEQGIDEKNADAKFDEIAPRLLKDLAVEERGGALFGLFGGSRALRRFELKGPMSAIEDVTVPQVPINWIPPTTKMKIKNDAKNILGVIPSNDMIVVGYQHFEKGDDVYLEWLNGIKERHRLENQK